MPPLNSCRRGGAAAFLQARRDDVAQERWSQLLAASVGVFDLRLPDGPVRAQAAYDLGLALALGKSCVIAVHADTPIPFDVEFAPVVLGDDADNARRLRAGVYEALSAVTRGGRMPQLGDAGRAALDALRTPHCRIGRGIGRAVRPPAHGRRQCRRRHGLQPIAAEHRRLG